MSYTIKTFLHNAKICFIEEIYDYVIFGLLVVYWLYSPNFIYNKSVELQQTPFEMVIVAGTLAMLTTSSLLVIYYNTRTGVIKRLKEMVEL